MDSLPGSIFFPAGKPAINGRAIVGIDFQKRVVTLDDGTELRLTADPRRHADRRLQAERAISQPQGQGGGSSFPAVVPRAGSEPGQAGSRSAIGDADHRDGGSTPVDPRSALHRDAGGLQHHDSGQSRLSPGND